MQGDVGKLPNVKIYRPRRSSVACHLKSKVIPYSAAFITIAANSIPAMLSVSRQTLGAEQVDDLAAETH